MTMSTENVIGLVLAVLLAVYLFAALLFPERF
jgi:K+-transporting ATPase KdpF subunit